MPTAGSRESRDISKASRESSKSSRRESSKSSRREGSKGSRHRGSTAEGRDGSKNSRRDSSYSSGSESQEEAGESKEESLYTEPLEFFNLSVLAQQLWGRCRKRSGKAKKWAKSQANQAKAGVANEFQQGWGKTKTARALADLRQIDKRRVRRLGRDLGQKAASKLFGSNMLSGRGKKILLEKAMMQGEEEGFGVHKFIIHNPGNIHDFFDIPDFELKVGGSAKVFRAVEKATHVARAIKQVWKRDKDFDRLVQEVSIMKMLDHPNIVKLFETFEDHRHLYLVLELCEGGDVLDRLLDHALTPMGRLSEFQTAVIIRTMLMTLNYLHVHGFVHRDIKPENILIKDKHHDILTSALRLSDFGYARRIPNGDEEDRNPPAMTTKVGSPCYVAPEVIRGEYHESCDLWSIGAVCYTLLCGYPPFCGDTDAQTLQMIQDGKYYFHHHTWEDISKPAKHFVRYLLHKDPKERFSVKAALEHPWVKARGVKTIERMREETIDRLITFHTYHKLRQSAMLAVAHQMESQDLRGLVELFQSLDLNGDGLLTSVEFRKSITAICGIEQTFISGMMASVDADNSGVIDFSEFVAATLEKDMYIKNHAALLRAFRCFDQDDGGSLTKEEIAETLCMEGEEDQEEVELFFAEVDLDGDGVMDYGEFYAMLQKETEVTRTADDDEDMPVLGSSEEDSEEDGEYGEEGPEEEEGGRRDEEAASSSSSAGQAAKPSPRESPKAESPKEAKEAPKKSKSSSVASSSTSTLRESSKAESSKEAKEAPKKSKSSSAASSSTSSSS